MPIPSQDSKPTTSKLKAPRHVVIVNPIHPLYGQSIPVTKLFSVGKNATVVAIHPDGGTITLPLAETRAEGEVCKPLAANPVPLFNPGKLSILAKRISVILTDSS